VTTYQDELQIPPQQAPESLSFPIQPRKLAAWIKNLPLANIGETAKLLFSLLKETNHTQLDTPTRLHMLEQLYPPLNYILNTLEKHYMGLSFPLPEKNRKISLLVKSMLIEVAICHKCIIEDSLKQPQVKIGRSQLNNVIYHAMVYNNRLMMVHYLTYTTVPPAIWREHHLLYQQAEGLQLHQTPFQDGEYPQSIANRYQQLLLLTLANPNGLSQNQIQQLDNTIAQWSAFTHLTSISHYRQGQSTLAVDLNSAAQPCRLNTPPAPDAAQDWRLIDTSQLLPVVQQQLTHQPENSKPLTKAPTGEMLIKAMNAWQGRSKRGFTRLNKNCLVDAAIGLSAIHSQLSQYAPDHQQSAHTPLDGRATFHAEALPSLNYNDAPDVWNLDKPPPSSPDAEQTKPAPYKSHPLNIVDESASGYKLEIANEQPPPQLHVGELISLHRPQQNQRQPPELLGLATIRWLDSSKQGRLQLGVQLLAPSAKPVEIALYNETSKASPNSVMRALVLPELPAIKQPATLITATTYHKGNNVLLYFGGARQHITLTKLVAHNPSFNQLQYKLQRTLEDPTTPIKQAHKQAQRDDEDLDTVWSLL